MFTRIRGVRMIIDRWGEFRFRTKRFFFCPSRSDYIASPQTLPACLALAGEFDGADAGQG